MNFAHLHLVLNHAPLFGLVFGFSLLMYSLRKRNDDVHRLALYAFIITSIIAVPNYISGENAEHMLKDANIAGLNLQAIGPHETTAMVANIFTILSGLLSVAWFFVKKPKIKMNISLSILGLSLVGIAYMARTANLGGQIRHTEIGEALTYFPDPNLRPSKDSQKINKDKANK